MTAKQQWTVVGIVVAVLAGGAFAGSRLLSDELTHVTVGTDAPDFQAVTLDSAPIGKTLADYRGEVVLLNIWATWCGPCRQEMPSIEAVHQALGPKGLKVVAISTDAPGKEQEIRDFVGEFGLTFDVVHDTTGRLGSTYRTTGVPETFVIARDGTIRKKWIGPEDWNSESNRRLLEQLLAEPRG
jgi:peroxiredoxin